MLVSLGLALLPAAPERRGVRCRRPAALRSGETRRSSRNTFASRRRESATRSSSASSTRWSTTTSSPAARSASLCPAALPPAARTTGTRLTPDQKKEVSALLRQLIQKNYQKNLEKTLDYEITYKGEKIDAGDTKIRTEAKSKSKPRDPVVLIDYVVREANRKLAIVDIVTEGTSLTKSYYEQFDKKLKDPALGYSNIVQKLRAKIATP